MTELYVILGLSGLFNVLLILEVLSLYKENREFASCIVSQHSELREIQGGYND